MTSLFKFGETQSLGPFGGIGSSAQDETLRKIFKSGEYSDLTVVSVGGREFKLHKAVVCSKSPYFAAAFRLGNFKEAATNRINLPEPDAIVEAVVKHIYGFTDSLLSGSPKKFQLAVVQSEDQNLGDLICLARIYFAADKYELPALRHLAGREFVPRLHQASPLSVMTVAAIIYDNTPENDMGLRSETCRYVRLHLTRFMADEPAKTELLNNKSLLQDLLTRLGACMQEYRNTTAKLSSV